MTAGKSYDLESLSDRLSSSASVRSVFGDPVTVGEKVIIPVARIMYGLGGGDGSGSRGVEADSEKPAAGGEAGGAGGGVIAAPVGVFEVSGEATRFVPASPGWLRTAAVLLAGIAIGTLVARGRRR